MAKKFFFENNGFNHRRKIQEICRFGSLVIIFVLFIPDVGSAVPVFRVDPMITFSGQFDSNFFYTENNERPVYTFVVKPGIQLGVETAKSKLDFIYTLNAYFYEDKDAVPSGELPADEENYIGHYIYLNATHLQTDRLTLLLNDTFLRTRNVVLYDPFTDNNERRLHNINRFTPGIYYDFQNRFSAGLRYLQSDIRYDDFSIDDVSEQRGIFDLLYNPARTRTFVLNYQLWDHDEEDDDYTSNQIQLIFQQRFKYFFLEVGGGYQNRRFTDPDMADGDTTVYRLAVGGQNPPSLKIGRRLLNVDALDIKNYRGDFSDLTSYVYFDYEKNFNDLGNFRIEDRFIMSLGHLFSRKIKAGVQGYYVISDYENFMGLDAAGDLENRKDTVYGISCSLRYLIKRRWDLLLTAGTTDQNSNLVGFSYKNNYFMIDLEFNYPLGRGIRR